MKKNYVLIFLLACSSCSQEEKKTISKSKEQKKTEQIDYKLAFKNMQFEVFDGESIPENIKADFQKFVSPSVVKSSLEELPISTISNTDYNGCNLSNLVDFFSNNRLTSEQNKLLQFGQLPSNVDRRKWFNTQSADDYFTKNFGVKISEYSYPITIELDSHEYRKMYNVKTEKFTVKPSSEFFGFLSRENQPAICKNETTDSYTAENSFGVEVDARIIRISYRKIIITNRDKIKVSKKIAFEDAACSYPKAMIAVRPISAPIIPVENDYDYKKPTLSEPTVYRFDRDSEPQVKATSFGIYCSDKNQKARWIITHNLE